MTRIGAPQAGSGPRAVVGGGLYRLVIAWVSLHNQQADGSGEAQLAW